MIRVTEIWRYPIKACGREMLDTVDLSTGTTLPGDRAWAVAHEAAKLTGGWSPCGNFARAAKCPALQAISAQTTGPDSYRLGHPERPDLSVTLPGEAGELLAWLAPLWPDNRPPLAQVVPSPKRGMTDSDTATISIMNHASLRAVSRKAGLTVHPERCRGNVWVDGAAPWEEITWVGKSLTLGPVTVKITEPITRCLALHANPQTGQRDADVLRSLNEDWGHQDFGVLAEITSGGTLSRGDAVQP